MKTRLKPLSEEALRERAEKFGFPVFDLREHSKLSLQAEFLDVMAWRFRAVPVSAEESTIIFAIEDPTDIDDLCELDHMFPDKTVHIRVADPALLDAFLHKHYPAGKKAGEMLRLEALQAREAL